VSDAMIGANRLLWDDWAAVNAASSFYDLDAFRAGAETTLRPLEVSELGDVAGKRLLHLMCHLGLDTLSLARRGALVTGCDLSEQAVTTATALAAELGLQARFLTGDVYDLPQQLDERFDVVFTSWGVLAWLADLPRWGQLIAHYLEPGGTFYIAEIHPVANVVEPDEDRRLVLTEGYLGNLGAERFETEGSYAARDVPCEHTVSYQWAHSLGDVVSALTGAGLVVEYVHEWPFSVYQRWPLMEQGDDGWWYVPGRRDLPLSFSLRARRPEA
jgi:2-polyprenyl-3-methyl-5-hydroxy-6-metoxy-1,4-benzoquinol methylase